MKIFNIEKLNHLISGKSTKRTETAGKPPGKAGAVRQDQVHLSQDAQQLSQLRKAADEFEEIRPEVVQRIQKQLKEGSYSPDNFKVAQKMLSQVIDEDLGE